MRIGIYEKALPKPVPWFEKLSLAKDLGFDFVQMSIDVTQDRIARLEWSDQEKLDLIEAQFKTGIKVQGLSLSALRKYPLGSADEKVSKQGLEILLKAIDFCNDLGIHDIMIAGYDVYAAEKTEETRENFIENLKVAVNYAASNQIMISIEVMDDEFISSISKFLDIKENIDSTWLSVYPDLGNLTAWPENNVGYELEKGIACISGIHVKDTFKGTANKKGIFRDVPWGEGDVDFLTCFRTLRRLGYDGSFVIEMWSEKSENPKQEIQKAQKYIYPQMEEAGYIFK